MVNLVRLKKLVYWAKNAMETLIVKVDNKKNVSFLRKLLLKFNFVLEVRTKTSVESVSELDRSDSVAGKLKQYSNVERLNEEKSVWEQVVKDKHGSH